MYTIGIDYTPAHEQGGGIGRYVRELVSALAKIDHTNGYRLFVAGATSSSVSTQFPENFTWCPTPLSTKWSARIWHRAHIPLPVEIWTGRVALYHSTDFVLPPTLSSTKTLLTVHDLSFLKTPETASPRLRNYLSRVVPTSVKRATHVLADSEATKHDLIQTYDVPPEKITTLLSGVSSSFHPVADQNVIQDIKIKYNIGQRPYLFSIGTVQPRKNYGRLVQALALLRQKGHDIQLVIAGGRGWLEDEIYKSIQTHHMEQYVKFIGFADDQDIPALYSGAICLAFISLYEGFGLPVLEAMACGTPVLTTNVSSLPEVAGDAAPMVSPTDIDAIVYQLERIITDSDYCNKLRQKGFAQAKHFTWTRSASQLLDVYQSLLIT